MVKVLRSQANPGLSKALALAQQRATELEAVLQASKAERQRLIQRCHDGEEKLKAAQNDVSAYKRTIREYSNAFHTLQSDARRRRRSVRGATRSASARRRVTARTPGSRLDI